MQDGLEHIHDVTIALDVNGRAQLLDLRLNRSVHVSFQCSLHIQGAPVQIQAKPCKPFLGKNTFGSVHQLLWHPLLETVGVDSINKAISPIFIFHEIPIKLIFELFIFTFTS